MVEEHKLEGSGTDSKKQQQLLHEFNEAFVLLQLQNGAILWSFVDGHTPHPAYWYKRVGYFFIRDGVVTVHKVTPFVRARIG